MSEQHTAGNGRPPTMNDTGGWIRPTEPRVKRRRWLVPALAVSVLVLIGTGSCSGFTEGVREGYASSTAGATTTRPAPTTSAQPTTPAASSATALAATGALVGASVGARSPLRPTTTTPEPTEDPVPAYLPDDNSEAGVNVEVDAYYGSCKDAKAAGAAPLHTGDPGYRLGLDRDKDGTACET